MRRLTGHDRRAARAALQDRLPRIEAEVAAREPLPMARLAMLDEKRPDAGLEESNGVGRRRLSSRGERRHERHEQRQRQTRERGADPYGGSA